MQQYPALRVRAVLFAAIVSSLIGCGDGTAPPAEPAIRSVQAATITVPRGFQTTSVVVVDRRDGYSGDITLVAQGVPNGLTVSFAPSMLTGSDEATQITISATIAVQPGPYSFTVRASGSGAPVTASIAVEVAEPSFSLSVGSVPTQLEQGATISLPITVARAGGYSNPIDLSISGVPSEISAVITPSRLQPGQNTATLQLTASFLATTATSTLTVRGQAVGLQQQVAAIPLAVVPTTTPAILVLPTQAIETSRGAVRTHAVNVLRFGGFTGDVSFELIGAPSGIVMTAPPLPFGQQTATLSFDVPVSVPQNVYSATLRAFGPSITPVNVPISIRVSTTFAFTHAFDGFPVQQSLNPSLTVARGATTELSLRTLRAIVTEIRLVAEDVPSTVTLSMPAVLPATPAEQVTAISLVVAPGAPVGLRTFRIRLRSDITGFERLSTVTLNVQ